MVRFCVGCPKRPLLNVVHPAVIVGDTVPHFIRPYTLLNPASLLLWHVGRNFLGMPLHHAFPGFAFLIRRILSSDKRRTTCHWKVDGPPCVFALSRVIGRFRPFITVSIAIHFGSPFLPFDECVGFGKSILKPLPASNTRRRRFCGTPKSATWSVP